MKARLTFTRIVATVACLIALVAYTAYSPVPAYACAGDCCECVKDGKKTSEGGCSGGQLCSCIHFDDGCSCSWTAGGNYCNPLLD
jgi:hypothetical protein